MGELGTLGGPSAALGTGSSTAELAKSASSFARDDGHSCWCHSYWFGYGCGYGLEGREDVCVFGGVVAFLQEFVEQACGLADGC